MTENHSSTCVWLHAGGWSFPTHVQQSYEKSSATFSFSLPWLLASFLYRFDFDHPLSMFTKTKVPRNFIKSKYDIYFPQLPAVVLGAQTNHKGRGTFEFLIFDFVDFVNTRPHQTRHAVPTVLLCVWNRQGASLNIRVTKPNQSSVKKPSHDLEGL